MFTRRRSATASRMRAVRFTRKARLGQPDGTRPNRLRHRDWSGLISNRRISSHGDSVIRWCCTRAESVLPSLLRLKGEIGSPWLAGGNRHLFRLGAIVFLPRSQGVAPRRPVFDRVVAVTVGGCVRPFDHNEPAVHPGMNVALHWNRDFLGLPTLLDRRRSRWLREIPRDITGHRVWIRVNVVRCLIAVRHLEILVDVHGQHVWRIHTSSLVEYRHRRWYLSERASS